MVIKRSPAKDIYSLDSEDCSNTLYLESAYDVALYLQSEEAFLPVTIDRLEVYSLEEVDEDESTR